MVPEMDQDSPLLDFDSDPSALLEPTAWYRKDEGLPSAAVITWMPDAFSALLEANPSMERHRLSVETADMPVHEVEIDGRPVVVALSHVGAPAAAILYEALIAMGCTSVVCIGSSGGLLPSHPPGTVVVPDAAIRDEGTSHHYVPAARLAHFDGDLQRALAAAFDEEGLAPVDGTVWTTDALFRETTAKVAQRVAEGAVAVDMEASALASIATHRGVRHGHAVYLADTLHSDRWDPGELIDRDTAYRHRLLRVAAEVAAGIAAV